MAGWQGPSAVGKSSNEMEVLGQSSKFPGGFHGKILKDQKCWDFPISSGILGWLGTFCAGFHGDHGVPTKAFNIF